MVIQIFACYSKAGSSWDAAIDLVCVKRGIYHFVRLEDVFCYFTREQQQLLDPDCDLQIIYKTDPAEFVIAAKIWGWEAKATDLHASQIGNEVAFEDEIIQHLVRNQSLTRYGAIVAGPQEQHDIMMFTGMCSKHGVNWNWCSTIEKAVEKCFELVENADRVIDCRKPIYINKDKDVPTFARMLAQIRGITGEKALELYDTFVKTREQSWIDTFEESGAHIEWYDFFLQIEGFLEGNLRRIYHDFINDGKEPHQNLLKAPNPKVKKTQRGKTP
jgi:hypothetical protein